MARACGSSMTSAVRDHAGDWRTQTIKQKAADIQRVVPTALKKLNRLAIARKRHCEILLSQVARHNERIKTLHAMILKEEKARDEKPDQ